MGDPLPLPPQAPAWQHWVMRTHHLLQLTAVLFLAVAGGCAAVAQHSSTPPLDPVVPLDRDRPTLDRVGGLRFRGALDLTGINGVGGLSGLWVSRDGARFSAIGDTGLVASGRLIHSDDGWLIGVRDVETRPLLVEEGQAASKRRVDAEEVLRLTNPDGSEGDWVVSFERDHRFLRYSQDGRGPAGVPTASVPTPPGVVESSPENGGLESLTQLTDGRFLTIEEGEEDVRRDPRQPRRAWVTAVVPGVPRQASDWRPFHYRSAPRFRPTGAAPLPDGGALVLERRVSLIGGWSTRIVRLPRAALHDGADVTGEEVARLEHPLLNDNFEGIATRPAPGGGTLVYIVSDDNFSPLQRSYLALFLLP